MPHHRQCTHGSLASALRLAKQEQEPEPATFSSMPLSKEGY
jgi:hypothetical protein